MSATTAIEWSDPVVEAYKRDVDRTLLRENLKLTPAERLLAVQRLVEFVEELRARNEEGERGVMTDFAGLIRVLVDNRVDFILIGGLAAGAHGAIRTTMDVDVVYARSEANIARLAAALAPLKPYLRGAPPGLPFRWDAETIAHGLNFTLTTTLGDTRSAGRGHGRRRLRAPSAPLNRSRGIPEALPLPGP